MTNYKEDSISTTVKYNNDDGKIDAEERGGTRYYLYKDPTPEAALKEQKFVREIFEDVAEYSTIEYNDSAKQLTLKASNYVGIQTYSQPADFAAGVRTQFVRFSIPLVIPDQTALNRDFSAEFLCFPLSEKKK